jgi:hypothetical protein
MGYKQNFLILYNPVSLLMVTLNIEYRSLTKLIIYAFTKVLSLFMCVTPELRLESLKRNTVYVKYISVN